MKNGILFLIMMVLPLQGANVIVNSSNQLASPTATQFYTANPAPVPTPFPQIYENSDFMATFGNAYIVDAKDGPINITIQTYITPGIFYITEPPIFIIDINAQNEFGGSFADSGCTIQGDGLNAAVAITYDTGGNPVDISSSPYTFTSNGGSGIYEVIPSNSFNNAFGEGTAFVEECTQIESHVRLANSVPFSGITSLPTSAAGYGITNGSNIDAWGAKTIYLGNLSIASGKSETFSNTLAFTGTDSSSINFGTGGTVTYTANNLSVFSSTTSSQLATIISDETGTGALVFGTSPSFTTPSLGAASATTLIASGNVTISNATVNTIAKFNGSKVLVSATAGTDYVKPANGNTGTPTIVYGTGANSPTGTSIVGNGESGTITFTTGAVPVASGTVLTATFASSFAYPTGSTAVIFPGNANAALLSGTSMLYSTGTTTTFALTSGTAALTALTTYILNYQVQGY